MNFNDDIDTPSVVVERAKREHTKNKGKPLTNDEARHARLARQAKMAEVDEDDDWRAYIDR
jgi:hypothetical protein